MNNCGPVTNADSDNDVVEAYAPTLGLIMIIVVNATKNVNPGLNASMDIVDTFDFFKYQKKLEGYGVILRVLYYFLRNSKVEISYTIFICIRTS